MGPVFSLGSEMRGEDRDKKKMKRKLSTANCEKCQEMSELELPVIMRETEIGDESV